MAGDDLSPQTTRQVADSETAAIVEVPGTNATRNTRACRSGRDPGVRRGLLALRLHRPPRHPLQRQQAEIRGVEQHVALPQAAGLQDEAPQPLQAVARINAGGSFSSPDVVVNAAPTASTGIPRRSRIAETNVSWRGQPRPTKQICAPQARMRAAIGVQLGGRCRPNRDGSMPAITSPGYRRASSSRSSASVVGRRAVQVDGDALVLAAAAAASAVSTGP